MRRVKISFLFIIIIAAVLLSIALVGVVVNYRIKNVEKKAEAPAKIHI